MDTPVINDVVVRPSTEVDVPAMVAIYAHHVRNGLGTFDPEPLHDEDIKRRRKNMMKRRLPHLVAERSGVIVGYACAVPFRKRRPIATPSSIPSTSIPIIFAPVSDGCCCRPS